MGDRKTRRSAQTALPQAAPLPPLYYRLYSSLLKQISDGIYRDGTRLPGEHELSGKFKVSRNTVRRALSRLEEEGFVSRTRGAGTFATTPAKPGKHAEGHVSLTDHMKTQSDRYDRKHVELAFIPTPNFLNAGPDGYGPVVLKLSTLSLIKGSAVHLHTAYVPERIGRRIFGEADGDETITALIQKIGIEIFERELFIEAAAADLEQAELLGVALGAPLTRGMHLSTGPDGRPVAFSIAYSRPDFFRYRFKSNEREGAIFAIPGLR